MQEDDARAMRIARTELERQQSGWLNQIVAPRPTPRGVYIDRARRAIRCRLDRARTERTRRVLERADEWVTALQDEILPLRGI